MEAELGVAVRFWVAIKQFLPEKLQGDTGAFELFFDVTKLGNQLAVSLIDLFPVRPGNRAKQIAVAEIGNLFNT